MTVLTKRETWRRSTALATMRTPELTDAERANLRRALLFLRSRTGSAPKLATLLDVSRIDRATTSKGAKGSALLALRAARLAGVSVEAVLGGAWPPEGACPHCGRD